METTPSVAGRSARENASPWSLVARVLFVLGLLAVWVVLIRVFIRETRANPWFLLFITVMGIVGLLMARYKAVDRAVNAILYGYFALCVWLLLALAPASIAFGIARALEAQSRLWLQVAAFGLWACLLACLIWFLATESSRTRLFNSLKRVGALAPAVYAVNVLLLALPFFGSLTNVLSSRGLVNMEGDARGAIDFYLWHFLDAIPLLKVNETILWSQPMAYHQSRVGWLVLLFKVTVIVPVIGAFRGYWKYTQTTSSSPAAAVS
jgi:hypothetical protein